MKLFGWPNMWGRTVRQTAMMIYQETARRHGFPWFGYTSLAGEFSPNNSKLVSERIFDSSVILGCIFSVASLAKTQIPKRLRSPIIKQVRHSMYCLGPLWLRELPPIIHGNPGAQARSSA